MAVLSSPSPRQWRESWRKGFFSEIDELMTNGWRITLFSLKSLYFNGYYWNIYNIYKYSSKQVTKTSPHKNSKSKNSKKRAILYQKRARKKHVFFTFQNFVKIDDHISFFIFWLMYGSRSGFMDSRTELIDEWTDEWPHFVDDRVLTNPPFGIDGDSSP